MFVCPTLVMRIICHALHMFGVSNPNFSSLSSASKELWSLIKGGQDFDDLSKEEEEP